MSWENCDNQESIEFLSLGTTPLANSFLKEEDIDKPEEKFPLTLCLCTKSKLVKLNYVASPQKMFREYVYVTSTTKTFRDHFTKMAQDITKDHNLTKDSLAVDIGSNDGLLLKGFQKQGVKVVGVEPAVNIAKIANEQGVETINEFFDEKVVQSIIKDKGKADVVTANNAFAHIEHISDVARNVKDLLKDSGVFIIEVQYFGDMIEMMTFDNIYHEHIYYYTVTSLSNFFESLNMQIVDVKKVDTHGGSLRVTIKKNQDNQVSGAVDKVLKHEEELELKNIQTYKGFAEKVYTVKKNLVSTLKEIKAKSKTIAAYGAPAKGNTLLNFCQIGTDIIDFIVEDNPLKVGLYAPGSHIPVVSKATLLKKQPDYTVILAWNFAAEIAQNNKQYTDAGGKFIIPLPSPKILGE